MNLLDLVLVTVHRSNNGRISLFWALMSAQLFATRSHNAFIDGFLCAHARLPGDGT